MTIVLTVCCNAPRSLNHPKVREAVMTHNYAAFFRLYATAPHLGRAIMDVVAENVRWQGLNAFVKACDLPVPVPALAAMLGFTPRPAGAPQAPGTPKAGPAGDGSDAQATGEAEAAPGAGEGAGAGARCPKAPLPGCQEVHLAGEAAAAESEEAGVEACAQWLRDHGAVVVDKGEWAGLGSKVFGMITAASPWVSMYAWKRPARRFRWAFCCASHFLSFRPVTFEGTPAISSERTRIQCPAQMFSISSDGAPPLCTCAPGGELQLDCKGSRGKLFIPEVPAKVAHGDENLSLTDFLSRAKATFAEGGPH